MRERISDKVRLLHIIDAINDIEKYFSSDINKLTVDKISRLACVKLFEIIGEAAYNITNETKEKYNAVPWKELSGMRHILVHEYYDIDFSIIQQIIQSDIPRLKITINNILIEFGNE